MTDPVIKQAIQLRDRLLDCAKEFRFAARRPNVFASGKEMAELDAIACEEAAEMMAKLGTEVTRLRLCIQHFDHGRMDRRELICVVKNWNDTPQPAVIT